MKLKDRVIIVFGGANGIGQASVLLLAEEGAKIVIADRDVEMAEKIAGILKDQGKSAIGLACDASVEDDIKADIDTTVDSYGGIHGLVNCVGVDIVGTVEDTESDLWDRSMEVNLKSVYYSCHYAMPHLKKNGGSIVNISSVQALVPVKGYAAYATAKGGMISLTRSMANDFYEFGIRANVICPGEVETNLGANSKRFEEGISDAEKRIDPYRPLESFDTELRPSRILMPEDIGRVVVFLISDDSNAMNGHELVLDAGYILNTYNNNKE